MHTAVRAQASGALEVLLNNAGSQLLKMLDAEVRERWRGREGERGGGRGGRREREGERERGRGRRGGGEREGEGER